ncbi:MAG: flavodoxin domain-containing protein [Candidatus Thorarchaeota archaeon]
MRVLIAYCTRYGATASTSEEIANGLRQEGFDVRVVNTKKEKVRSISEYDLVIVGAGLQMFRWCKESEKFLKKFQKDLRAIRTAIFASSGGIAIMEFDGQTEEMEDHWQKHLVDKAEEYSIVPIALGRFGGIWDYNKMNFVFRKSMGPFRMKHEEVGIKEVEPGVYDTRDWDEIRKWTNDLAQKVKGNET